jgi:hypothetical protein
VVRHVGDVDAIGEFAGTKLVVLDNINADAVAWAALEPLLHGHVVVTTRRATAT